MLFRRHHEQCCPRPKRLPSAVCIGHIHSITQLLTHIRSYVNRDREITRKYVQHAEKRGVKGLFITVDAPQLGRREKDMRMKGVDDDAGAEVQRGQKVEKNQGVSRAISVRSYSRRLMNSLTYDSFRSLSLILASTGAI